MAVPELTRRGATRSQVTANLAARRWRRCGRAIILHAGPLARPEQWHAALINSGERRVLTSFTAAEFLGLTGWERDATHVLVPHGVSMRRVPELPVVLHPASSWPVRTARHNRCQELSGALLRAAASFDSSRPACGLLAAAVQQRLTTPVALRRALDAASRTRHRAALRAAVEDIAGGAQALTEIDFIRLCRAAGLPLPEQQGVRLDGSGRRRYLAKS